MATVHGSITCSVCVFLLTFLNWEMFANSNIYNVCYNNYAADDKVVTIIDSHKYVMFVPASDHLVRRLLLLSFCDITILTCVFSCCITRL